MFLVSFRVDDVFSFFISRSGFSENRRRLNRCLNRLASVTDTAFVVITCPLCTFDLIARRLFFSIDSGFGVTFHQKMQHTIRPEFRGTVSDRELLGFFCPGRTELGYHLSNLNSFRGRYSIDCIQNDRYARSQTLRNESQRACHLCGRVCIFPCLLGSTPGPSFF
jgi:hypothetical protein